MSVKKFKFKVKKKNKNIYNKYNEKLLLIICNNIKQEEQLDKAKWVHTNRFY